jgi:hypothetical protein
MIKRIAIQNYRSLETVVVDLDPLTVLIGRSGTGKSNFVGAIRLLRTLLTARDGYRNVIGTLRRQILPMGRDIDQLRYCVILSIPGLPNILEYSVTFADGPGKQLEILLEERLSSDDEVVYQQRAGRWIIAPSITPAPSPGQLALGLLTGVRPATIAYVALTTGIGCYDFPGSVLQPAGEPVPGSGLTDDGGNYLTTATGLINNLERHKDWTALCDALRSINRTVRNVDLHAPERKRLDVVHAIGDKQLLLDVAEESEGFRRFLAYLLALYQTPPKQTLIFEHPESGIHPAALTALFEEFEGYVRSGRGQIILTTHSPQFLNHIKAESIRVVDIQDQTTQIGPLAPEQREAIEEHLLEAGELFTVDPARLPGQLDEVPG